MTWDIWDTDYNSDNWKTEFIIIFVTVTKQFRVTLDIIGNSCNVFNKVTSRQPWWRDKSAEWISDKFLRRTEEEKTKTNISVIWKLVIWKQVVKRKNFLEIVYLRFGFEVWNQLKISTENKNKSSANKIDFEHDGTVMKMLIKNIARNANAVHCHSWLSGITKIVMNSGSQL